MDLTSLFHLRHFCFVLLLGSILKLSAQSPDVGEMAKVLTEMDVLMDSLEYEAAIETGESWLETFELSDQDEALPAELLLKMAKAHSNLKQNSEALTLARKALPINIHLHGEESLQVAQNIASIGNALRYLEEFDAAIDTLFRAIEIAEKLSSADTVLVNCYHDLGASFRRQYRLEEARTYSLKALGLAEKIYQKDDPELADIYNLMGGFYYQESMFDSTIFFLKKALHIFEHHFGEKHPKTGILYGNIGIFFSNQEMPDSALSYHYKALAARNNPDERAVSISYIGMGLKRKGYNVEAEQKLKEAVRIWFELYPEGRTYMTLAMEDLHSIYISKGDFVNAQFLAEKILSINQRVYGDIHPESCLSYSLLSRTYGLIGDTDKEELYLNRSLEIAAQLPEYANFYSGIIHHDLAELMLKADRVTEGTMYATKAVEELSSIFGELDPSLIDSYNVLLETYTTLGNYDEALKIWEKVGNIYDTHQDNLYADYLYSVLDWYKNAGKLFRELGQYDISSQHLNKGLTFANTFPDSLRTQFPIFVSNLIYESALTSEAIYKQTKQIDQLLAAHAYIDEYVHFLDRIKRFQVEANSRSILISNYINRYEKAIEIALRLYETHKEVEYLHQAFTYSEKTKSMLLLESVKDYDLVATHLVPDSLLEEVSNLNADRNNYSTLLVKAKTDDRSDSLSSVYRQQLFEINRRLDYVYDVLKQDYPEYYQLKFDYSIFEIADIQESLSDNQGIVEYFVGDSSLYCFLIKQKSVEVHTSALDVPLVNYVNELRSSTYNYWIDPQRDLTLYHQEKKAFIQAAHQLYTILLDPIRDKLPSELIIVPDGVLGYVSFDALLSSLPEDEAYINTFSFLIKDFQISYAYSATLLMEMIQKDHHPNKRLLAFAPAFEGEETSDKEIATMRKGLGRLTFNEPEVRSIQTLMGGDVYVKDQALASTFQSKAEEYQILHLSTHAKAVDETEGLSFLAFTEVADTVDHKFIYMNDLYNLKLNADLVVLSACETGLGELKKGEGILSIARAFTYAGAKSIVNSLWSVDDESTKFLMEHFYSYIKEGKRKDEALRLAKLDYLNSENMSDPFFWAAFIPVGDMSPIQFVDQGWTRYMWIVLIILTAIMGYFFLGPIIRSNT